MTDQKPKTGKPDRGVPPPAPNLEVVETLRALGVGEATIRYAARSLDADAQIMRAAVLRMLWDLVIDEDDYVGDEPRWIESWQRVSHSENKVPKGVAAAIARVLACGVDPKDLTDIVRAEQYNVILNVCDLVDGEHLEDLRERIPSLPELSLRLYAVNDTGDEPIPMWPIESLHESIGSMDPTGREGEPRAR